MLGSTRPAVGISVEGLGFRFDGDNKPLFHGLSLTFGPGQITALLGPSGVGKTTLLNLIVGFARPAAGLIAFSDHVAHGRPRMGMVFQTPSLMPWRTVIENVLFGVEVARRDDRAAADRGRAFLTRLGLGGRLDAFPHELSGGMQQRVSVVRAILPRPQILLLDEPFTSSDWMTRHGLLIEISEAVTEANSTAILVTHDLEDALRFADRLVVLGGRPVQILDDFMIEGPRELRLVSGGIPTAALKAYRNRVQASWGGDGSSVP
jgi:NitT/TauT family transport system ATP-binding protein